MKRLFITLLLLGFYFLKPASCKAQVNVQDSLLKFTMVHVNASLNWPLADMKDRFGFFSGIGISAVRKTKNAWLFGGSASFYFGSQVKEKSMLDAILVDDGFLVSTDGTLSDIRYGLRGLSATAGLGKMFPAFGPNVNCGPFIFLSAGFIEHRIHFDTDRGTTVPSLEGDYKKGYDRLSSGLLTTASLGYQYLSKNTMVNFFIKIDYNQGFTKNIRKYNYDTGLPDNTKRNDGFLNFSFGWTLPIYRKAATDYYYF